MVRIVVDQKEIEAESGATLLQTCLDNDIYIPNLCYLEGMDHPPASCRLCFVEIEGHDQPIASCTVTVREGMRVETDTPAVRQLQRTALQLLLSVHEVHCGPCPANKKCELQRMAKFLKVGLKPKHLVPFLKETTAVTDHPFLDYYPNRCVLCGRCIHVCRLRHGRAQMTFAKRGLETIISFFGDAEASVFPCPTCGACADICPVGALALKGKGQRENLAAVSGS